MTYKKKTKTNTDIFVCMIFLSNTTVKYMYPIDWKSEIDHMLKDIPQKIS